MKKIISLFLPAIIFIYPALSMAEVITHRVIFDRLDLKFTKLNQYDIVTMQGLEVTYDPGAPQLPFYLARFIIAAGEKIAQIETIETKTEQLEGDFQILPCQKPEILSAATISNKQFKLSSPNVEIYASDQIYPYQIIEEMGTGHLGNMNIITLRIYPLQYLPLKKKLLFYSEIYFKITTAPIGVKLSKPLKSSTNPSPVLEQLVKELVINSEELKLITTGLQNIEPENHQENYQYVIITSGALEQNFKPLRDWKHKKGVPAKIATVEWIYDQYQGIDNQEKIRNFITQAYQNWGTIWILLGGDTNIIPARTAFAMDCEFGADPRENEIPCDLYYADLDGSWNEDGDNIYGEIDDNVDLYPEVIIGRAPVESAAETDIFVNKVLTFEKNPPSGYQRDLLFAAEILWNEPYTNTGIGKDMIETAYLPSNFYHITKLYEDLGNESPASVRNAINQGQHIINHHGHASTTVMGMGSGYFRKNDMLDLINGSKQSILYSIGCYPANFESDCIAEAFINNANGGGVAFIGNSRYGWGSPGNPGYGYSDRFDAQFFKFLFKEKNYQIGTAIALAKAFYIPFARQENVYRWCMYEINLLGDPEMPVWTDIPDTLTVQYPKNITIGKSEIPITVTNRVSPVPNALVCLRQGEEAYQYGNTDRSGQIMFAISTGNSAENLFLTVTAPDFLPYEKAIPVVSEAAYIFCSQIMIDDSQGNHDGLINPGEKILLTIKLKNHGNLNANSVTAEITCTDSLISIIDKKLFAGDIAAGDSLESSDTFVLQISPICKNSHVIHLNMKISDSTGGQWDQVLSLTCATPVLVLGVQRIDDLRAGNGNGIPEPGEQITLFTIIRNIGLAPARDVKSMLTTDNPHISIDQEIGSLGDIPYQGAARDSFRITISNGYPDDPSFPKIKLELTTTERYSFSLSFTMAIGKTGFQDDMEHGAGNWQLPGANSNHWHLSTRNYHSGSCSWYCGDKETGAYFQKDNSILEMPSVYIGQNAQLTFWAWYNVAIYGVNGFYVKLFDGNSWYMLDFIGSGGALDSTLMGNDWLPYTYDLSAFKPGTLARVQFHWVSDDQPLPQDELSGVFIDDVEISSQIAMASESKLFDLVPIPEDYELAQNYPNPFNAITTINYSIAGNYIQKVTLSIYNLLGRKVKTLINRKIAPGYHTVLWDGKDEAGELMASGVYIYQLKMANFKIEKKMILLR